MKIKPGQRKVQTVVPEDLYFCVQALGQVDGDGVGGQIGKAVREHVGRHITPEVKALARHLKHPDTVPDPTPAPKTQECFSLDYREPPDTRPLPDSSDSLGEQILSMIKARPLPNNGAKLQVPIPMGDQIPMDADQNSRFTDRESKFSAWEPIIAAQICRAGLHAATIDESTGRRGDIVVIHHSRRIILEVKTKDDWRFLDLKTPNIKRMDPVFFGPEKAWRRLEQERWLPHCCVVASGEILKEIQSGAVFDDGQGFLFFNARPWDRNLVKVQGQYTVSFPVREAFGLQEFIQQIKDAPVPSGDDVKRP